MLPFFTTEMLMRTKQSKSELSEAHAESITAAIMNSWMYVKPAPLCSGVSHCLSLIKSIKICLPQCQEDEST